MKNEYANKLSAVLGQALATVSAQNYQRYAAYQRERLTLFFAQGRVVTADLALRRSRFQEEETKLNDDKAQAALLLAENLQSGVEGTMDRQNVATDLVSKMADETQVAANAVANLASESAGLLAICEATMSGSDITTRASQIDACVKRSVVESESASLNSLDATTHLSQSIIPAMDDASLKIKNAAAKLGKRTSALFNQAKNEFVEAKQAMDKARRSASLAKQKYIVGQRYLDDADESMSRIGGVINLGLTVDVECGRNFTFACRTFRSPFSDSMKSGSGSNVTFPSGEDYRLFVVCSKDVESIDREEFMQLSDSRSNAPTGFSEDKAIWQYSSDGDRYPELVDLEGEPLRIGENYQAIVRIRLPLGYEWESYSENIVSLPSRRFRPQVFLPRAGRPQVEFGERRVRFSAGGESGGGELDSAMEYRVMLVPCFEESAGRSEGAVVYERLSQVEASFLGEVAKPADKIDIQFLKTLLEGVDNELVQSLIERLNGFEELIVERLRLVERFDALIGDRSKARDETERSQVELAIGEIERETTALESGIRQIREEIGTTFARMRRSATDEGDGSSLLFDYKIANALSAGNYTAVAARSGKQNYEIKIDLSCADICGNLLYYGRDYRAVVLSTMVRLGRGQGENAYRPMLSEYSEAARFERIETCNLNHKH